MRSVKTNTPPMWKVRDGESFIVVIYCDGDETREVWAPIGDGAWFFTDGWNKLVAPRLKAAKAPVDYSDV
jgi:hypothetical protein